MSRFKDVPPDHTHAGDIEWLAEKEVTKGANPPANDLFKPDEPVTRGQMASFLRRLYELNHAPEPEPDRKLLWSTDFSNGYADYDTDPFSNSGDSGAQIVDAPQRSGKALAMSVGSADKSAIRLRMDGKTITIPGYTGLNNLPPAAWYGAWFYLPEHVRVGSGDGSGSADAWNIFQWKQRRREDSNIRTRMMHSIRLRDFGDTYAFTLDTRAHEDDWQSQKIHWFADDSVRVKAGEWFHVEALRFCDPSEGRIVLRVNGVEALDQTLRTEYVGGGWDDVPWRRQWTVNDYPSISLPNTLYVTDLAIHTE